MLVQSHHPRREGLLRWDRRGSGFTLVEALLVIALIALLLALLLPSLRAARESARTVFCASQMRHLYFTLHQYSEDYENYIMPQHFQLAYQGSFETWGTRIYRTETGQAPIPETAVERTKFSCPSEPGHGYYDPPRGPYHTTQWMAGEDYAINAGNWDAGLLSGGIRTPDPPPATTRWLNRSSKWRGVQPNRFLLVDSERYAIDWYTYNTRNPIAMNHAGNYGWGIDSRHYSTGDSNFIGAASGKPNMCYFDGHVELRQEEMPGINGEPGSQFDEPW